MIANTALQSCGNLLDFSFYSRAAKLQHRAHIGRVLLKMHKNADYQEYWQLPPKFGKIDIMHFMTALRVTAQGVQQQLTGDPRYTD